MVHILKLVCILSYMLNTFSGHYVSACKDNERYYHGRCEPCDECDYPGYFLNKTTLLPANEKNGNLECFPCDPCPEGTYRSANSFSKICFTCMLDCKALNRLSDQACGGPYEGRCGNCLDGYEPPDNTPDSKCGEKVKRNEVTIDPVDPKSKSTSLPEQFITFSNLSNIFEKTTDATELERSMTPHGQVILTLSKEAWLAITVVAVAFIGVVLFIVLYSYGCSKNRLINTNPCSASEFSSISSTASGKPFSKSDLETDCFPTPECEPLTREGPAALCYENEAKSASEFQLLTKTKKINTTYPEYQLSDTPAKKQFIKDCFMEIASNIFGENKIKFYEYLGLKPSEYAENSDKEDDKEHVYNVLKIWHQRYYPGTIRHLCCALDKAEFHDVALQLVQLYNNFVSNIDTELKS